MHKLAFVSAAFLASVGLLVLSAHADVTFDNLVSQSKFKEAIEYADNNLPAGQRTVDVWIKMGQSNEALGMTEKALACYLVSWRMNPKEYGALLGAAKIYNRLNQYDQGLTMAKSALEQNFTGEASWEYARACIALGRPAEAKKALEKVLETDPSNMVANRELGGIYFNDKQYAQALPLMRRSLADRKDPELSLKIGQAYKETGAMDSALIYLEKAMASGLKSPQVTLDLAVVYYGRANYPEAASKFDRAVSEGARLAADDYYSMAVAKEKSGDARAALSAYRQAVAAFGGAKSEQALTARLRVGTAALDNKEYAPALEQFQFISGADAAGAVVPNVNFLLADVYQGMKNTPQAISSLERAIAKDSRNYEAYARLAELYTSAGMVQKAQKTYETMIALSPNDPKVYLVLGQFNLKSKKYAEALDLFGKSNSLASSSEADEGTALAAMGLGQWNRARDAANAAVSKNPNLIESRKILADVYIRAKEYKDALPHLEFLIGTEPYNRQYLVQLSDCYEDAKDLRKLADVDRKIVALDKSNVVSRVRLGNYMLANDNSTGAYEMYSSVTSLDPKNAEAWQHLFEIARKQGKAADATRYLNSYLLLKPSDAERQRDLGDLYYDQKDFDKALAAYRMVLKLDPTVKGFYKRYAEVVIAKGQQGEVIGALQSLIKSGDADMSTYTTLAMIYEKQKQYKSALDVYQQALALNPQSLDLLSALASCQASFGDVNGAIITYEQTVMMNPAANKEYKALGDLYSQQRKSDLAMKAYMSYLDKDSSDEGTARRIGFAAYDRKMYDQAVKYLGMVKSEKGRDGEFLGRFGQSLYYVGKCDAAAPVLERVRNSKPSAPQPVLRDVTRMLAECYEKVGNNLEAAKAYAAYTQFPGIRDAGASFKSAELQEKANLPAALKIYEANVRNFPNDYRNYVKLGVLYAQDKAQLQKSVAMLKKATSLADTVPAVWMELAGVYGRLGKEDEELNAYREYTKSDPQNAQANKRLGLIMLKRGRVTDALVYLETANAVAANDPEVIGALGEGYVKTNRKKEAVDLLLKVKALRQGDPEIRLKIVGLYNDLGKNAEAEAEAKSLVDLKRDNKYLLMYAQIQAKNGKLKEAQSTIEDILATNPESIDALLLKGDVLRGQKKLDEAVEAYKEITYIDPNHARALYERAEVHILQSKPQWAATFYQRALRADPNFALAEFGLAKLSKLGKDKAGYMQHMEKAHQLDPNNKEINEEWQKGGK